IVGEYIGSLDDGHTVFSMPSTFVAQTGLAADIYDGKVLVESITFPLLPPSQYPISIGDEIVSVDGKTAEELLEQFTRLRKRGNPLTSRRAAADLIVYRPQSAVPRAVELGDSSNFVFRKADGSEYALDIPWTKSGYPLTTVGPVPMPRAAERSNTSDPMSLLNELRNFRAPLDDHLTQGETWLPETGETVPRRYVLGIGALAPFHVWPPGFVLRRGGAADDVIVTGTYQSNGFRIGYLRIPSFDTGSTLIAQLDPEIAFFERNTDGLVVNVRRNPGGDCIMLDVAKRLIPYTFYFFGEQYRPTQSLVNSFTNALTLARNVRAEPWVIDLYQAYLDQILAAYQENRGMTGPIPACIPSTGPITAPAFENEPAAIVYTKPLIVLTDEFSISAGDIFPAMMQDNRRGPIVGTRTCGAGGSVSSWTVGMYSELVSRNTNSLVVRKDPIVTSDYPVAPYIENIGVRPDIPLEYMTRENLLQNGRPFVEGFTQIIVDHIRQSRQ
ncbi:MAG: S41 family peptidase, partial [Bryobacter sp.]|nr:S41 family peptidase [Bryobacter sp.]